LNISFGAVGEHKENRDFQSENHGFVEGTGEKEELPATSRAAVGECGHPLTF
jgi:hypothetical protein